MMVYIYIKTLYKASYVPWGLVNRWPLSRGGFVAMTSGPMPASSQLQATVLQPLRPQCRSLVDRLQVQGALLRGFLAHQEVLVTSANQKACIYIYILFIYNIYTYIYTFYLHMIYFICVGESRVLHGFILPMVWWTTRSKMMLLQFTCSTCWFCFGPTPPPRTQSSPPGLRQFLVRNSWNKPFICHRVWYRYNTYLSKTSQT